MEKRSLAALIAPLLLLSASPSNAHEMTPAYPQMKPTSVDGVIKFEMSLFNARDDVEWFMIAAFDKDFQPRRFATESNILHVKPNERINFNVYFRKQDVGKTVYVCTQSKLRGEAADIAMIASTICSRIDGARP